MDHRDILDGIFSPGGFLADREICSTRRGLLAAPLLASLSLALSDEAARAGTINPSETEVTLPGAIKWGGWIAGSPPHSGEMATLCGGLDKPGLGGAAHHLPSLVNQTPTSQTLRPRRKEILDSKRSDDAPWQLGAPEAKIPKLLTRLPSQRRGICPVGQPATEPWVPLHTESNQVSW